MIENQTRPSPNKMVKKFGEDQHWDWGCLGRKKSGMDPDEFEELGPVWFKWVG